MSIRHPSLCTPTFRFSPSEKAKSLSRHGTRPTVPPIVPTGRWSPPVEPAEDGTDDGLMQRLTALGWEHVPLTEDYVWRRTHPGDKPKRIPPEAV